AAVGDGADQHPKSKYECEDDKCVRLLLHCVSIPQISRKLGTVVPSTNADRRFMAPRYDRSGTAFSASPKPVSGERLIMVGHLFRNKMRTRSKFGHSAHSSQGVTAYFSRFLTKLQPNIQIHGTFTAH
ncbi:MAG: hypothetical protein ABJ005_08740, partial [Alloalcanivorax venustensis]